MMALAFFIGAGFLFIVGRLWYLEPKSAPLPPSVPATWWVKLKALSLLVLMCWAVSLILAGYIIGERRSLTRFNAGRGILKQDKLEAYNWIREHAAPDAKLISCEDAYLWTDRKSMTPFTFSTDILYDAKQIDITLAHMQDVAEAIHADYWIFAEDDLGFWWADRPKAVDEKMHAIENSLPLVFRSSHGWVRVRAYGKKAL